MAAAYSGKEGIATAGTAALTRASIWSWLPTTRRSISPWWMGCSPPTATACSPRPRSRAAAGGSRDYPL